MDNGNINESPSTLTEGNLANGLGQNLPNDETNTGMGFNPKDTSGTNSSGRQSRNRNGNTHGQNGQGRPNKSRGLRGGKVRNGKKSWKSNKNYGSGDKVISGLVNDVIEKECKPEKKTFTTKKWFDVRREHELRFKEAENENNWTLMMYLNVLAVSQSWMVTAEFNYWCMCNLTQLSKAVPIFGYSCDACKRKLGFSMPFGVDKFGKKACPIHVHCGNMLIALQDVLDTCTVALESEAMQDVLPLESRYSLLEDEVQPELVDSEEIEQEFDEFLELAKSRVGKEKQRSSVSSSDEVVEIDVSPVRETKGKTTTTTNKDSSQPAGAVVASTENQLEQSTPEVIVLNSTQESAPEIKQGRPLNLLELNLSDLLKSTSSAIISSKETKPVMKTSSALSYCGSTLTLGSIESSGSISTVTSGSTQTDTSAVPTTSRRSGTNQPKGSSGIHVSSGTVGGGTPKNVPVGARPPVSGAGPYGVSKVPSAPPVSVLTTLPGPSSPSSGASGAPSVPPLGGLGTVSVGSDDRIIRIRARWWNRCIFGEVDREYNADENFNRRMGKNLRKEKQKGHVLIPDDWIMEDLYCHLRLMLLSEYPDRRSKLDHMTKTARKWVLENKIQLDSSRKIDSFRLTIQKVVDQRTDDFLSLPDADEEEVRRKRFTGLWLRKKLGISKKIRYFQ